MDCEHKEATKDQWETLLSDIFGYELVTSLSFFLLFLAPTILLEYSFYRHKNV